MSLHVQRGVAEAFKHVLVAVILKDAVLQQLLLAMLSRVKSHASRFATILFPLPFFLVEELSNEFFAALLRQRLVVIDMDVPAVVNRTRAFDLLVLAI